MAELNAARRFAAALESLAVEADAAETVGDDLASLLEALQSEGGELFRALTNPVITVEERAGVLGAILPRLSLQQLTQNFVRLLSDRGRMGLLPDITRVYTELMDARLGRVRVLVSTVDPLSPQLEAELTAAFEKATGKTVLLDARIDTSLLGGLVARIGSRVYDASLRRRLEDLKHRLINAPALAEA